MRVTVGGADTSLFEVYAVDFEDNYHRTDDQASSELERAAKRIRRRYKNMGEYLKAVAVYREYMAHLIMKHGGPRMFNIKMKNDQIDEFVPARPRMKNTVLNKALLKKGIVLSHVNTNNLNEELIAKLTGVMAKEGPEDLTFDSESKDKLGDKLVKKGVFDNEVEKIKNINHLDYLTEYFQNRRAASKAKEEKERDFTLSDVLEDRVDIVEDTTEQDDVILFRRSFLNREALDELKVYQKLNELGWNSMKMMKKGGVSKKITKIVKNQKKDNKKKKGKKKAQDDFLVQVVMDGKFDSFGDFQSDMMDFTSGNIFK